MNIYNCNEKNQSQYIIYFLRYNIVISVQNYLHISMIISFFKFKIKK